MEGIEGYGWVGAWTWAFRSSSYWRWGVVVD
jgi:hypothetical protein